MMSDATTADPHQRPSPREWLHAWFGERNPSGNLSGSENFFEREAVDSFGVIELLGDMEDRFAVHFDEDDFRDERFVTIDGLSQMIEEKQDLPR